MDEAIITDLKYFIANTVSQQASELKEELTKELTEKLTAKLTDVAISTEERISSKIDDLAAAVAEAIDNSNEATETQFKDHERRITQLEQNH